MKVAFWSNAKGRGSVTSNLACMSIMQSLMRDRKIIMFENHPGVNDLYSIFMNAYEAHPYLYESCQYDDYLVNMLKGVNFQCQIYPNQFWQSTISFLDHHLYYIPACRSYNQESIEFWLKKNLRDFLDKLDLYADDVFIDTASSSLESSHIILDEADRVVVNLSQNPRMLEHYFRNFHSIQKKAFYLIGNYNPESMYSIEYISQKYGISSSQIGVIPYHVPFSDSLYSGRLIHFLQENCSCSNTNQNYYFMQELCKNVKKMEVNRDLHEII